MNAENLKKEIKKVKIWHIAVLCAGVFLAFAIIGSILVAAGGGWLYNGFHFSRSDFPPIGPGKLYDVNDHSELDLAGVDSVVIIAVSDDVTVKSGGEKIVSDLKGQCRSSTEPVKLDAHKDGGAVTIEVKYPRTIHNSNTALTVTIPEGYAGSLSVTTVSGGVFAEGLPFNLQSVDLHSVSGGLRFGAQSYAGLKAETTSGDINVSGIAGATTANTISGDVNLDFTAAVATTVTTISGGVTAAIPQNAAFKVDFGTVSGSFRSNHPALSVTGASHGFSGAMSGGTELLKVNTTSGDFRIEGK